MQLQCHQNSLAASKETNSIQNDPCKTNSMETYFPSIIICFQSIGAECQCMGAELCSPKNAIFETTQQDLNNLEIRKNNSMETYFP